MPPVFEFEEISLLETATLIHDFKCTSSAGVDDLTSRIIKAAGPAIIPVIRYLINWSIRGQEFPEVWRIGCVTPVFKEGDRSDPSNYRPISILPCLGKLTERVIHTQLYKYVTDHDSISKCQSGFRKGHSTGTCLISFLSNIYQQVDDGGACGVLFLDLKKAFNTVNREILLKKTSGVNWIKSYITDRYQDTKVGHSISNRVMVNCGVPLGSILGPLLFTLYINDLPSVVPDVHMNWYADDTTIMVSGKLSVEKEWKLNCTSKTVAAWFSYNKLSLNLGKTNFMLFGTHQTCR